MFGGIGAFTTCCCNLHRAEYNMSFVIISSLTHLWDGKKNVKRIRTNIIKYSKPYHTIIKENDWCCLGTEALKVHYCLASYGISEKVIMLNTKLMFNTPKCADMINWLFNFVWIFLICLLFNTIKGSLCLLFVILLL